MPASSPFSTRTTRRRNGVSRNGTTELKSPRQRAARLSCRASFWCPPRIRGKRREVLRDWYIARAKEKILARVEQHARELGIQFTAAKIVDNRYRWGSCTVNDSVNFNWRLIKAPMFVIDYVIIHELAHLIEANHTSRFWSIVRASTPTMEKAKAWLKEHGQVLEEEV